MLDSGGYLTNKQFRIPWAVGHVSSFRGFTFELASVLSGLQFFFLAILNINKINLMIIITTLVMLLFVAVRRPRHHPHGTIRRIILLAYYYYQICYLRA